MQKLKSITFVLLCGLAAVGMAPSGAAKASVLFEYNSSCVEYCATWSMTDGDPVSGTIEFNSANFAPDAYISSSDVIDYYFEFGSIVLNADWNVPLYFSGELDESASSFSDFVFVAAVFYGQGDGPAAILAKSEYSKVTENGYCRNVGPPYDVCSYVGGIFDHRQLGPGPVIAYGAMATLSRVTVPEPGTVTLFGVGLLGLTLLARRRRRAA